MKNTTDDHERSVYRKDIIPEFARRANIDPRLAAELLETFEDMVTDYLCEGTSVYLTGFGVFRIRPTSQRPARNPRTMQDYMIPAGYKPEFKASQNLRETVDRSLKEGNSPKKKD